MMTNQEWALVGAEQLFKDGVRTEDFKPATDNNGRDISQARHNERVRKALINLWAEKERTA